MSAERQRLPLLLLSLLAESPRHGYALNEEIERRSVRQWAAVGLSSIYQTLERMAAEGLLAGQEQSTDGQGARLRTVYSITAAGRTRLQTLIHASLASTEHQRFDYDLGVGVGLTHLSHAEVRQALEQRRIAIQAQAHRAAEACEWW
ncbi:MAG: helix-turn-helix transcriptional regulator, partial [Chloroflexota bacterium]